MTLEASKRAVSCAACWPTDSMASQRGPAASQSPHSTCTSPVPTITALHLAICESPLIPTPTRACSPLSPPDRTSSAFPAMAAAEEGGFVFDLCKRNDFFEKQGVKGPGFTKTGTTIAGIIFKVCLGVHQCGRARRRGRRAVSASPLHCRLTRLSPSPHPPHTRALRTAWCWAPTRGPLRAPPWPTRTARRSTTSRPTSTAAALAPPPTPKT